MLARLLWDGNSLSTGGGTHRLSLSEEQFAMYIRNLKRIHPFSYSNFISEIFKKGVLGNEDKFCI